LPDTTPFGLVELDMRGLVDQKVISKEVYESDLKRIQARHHERQRKRRGEAKYHEEVEAFQA